VIRATSKPKLGGLERIERQGPDRGQHASTAVGMAELPFGSPVEIEAEVLVRS
jgi:hypothetical protein